jgi:hypothetical protein
MGRFSFSSSGTTSGRAGLPSAAVSAERLARMAAAPTGILCPFVKNGCKVVGGIAFRAVLELSRAMEGGDDPRLAAQGLQGTQRGSGISEAHSKSQIIVD